MSTEIDSSAGRTERVALGALICAILGVAAVVVAYWLVLPAVVLGLVAVVLGVIARRRSAPGAQARDLATAAVCLGAVAMLFTPVVIMHTSGAEDWGRDCALRPEQDPNCPKPVR